MEIILNILYLYIAVYSVYYLISAIRNLNDKKFKIVTRYNELATKNHLAVVIYAQDDKVKLSQLINCLRAQDYSSENFSTYVILDNCTDGSQELFKGDKFVQVLHINNDVAIGKDQAVSILLEKISSQQNIDAYVFLDVERCVEADFLTNINSALSCTPVLSGSTVLMGENFNLRQKIKSVYHRYYTNFLQKSRSLMGFACTIDSDIFVMKKDLLEKIGCIDFQNINTELKYSLLLSNIGYPCHFYPNVKTYIGIDDFKLRIPSLNNRLVLFKDCFTRIWTPNLTFAEQTFSLLNPNIWVLMLSYIYLLRHSLKYYFFVDFSVVLLTFIALTLGFAISLLSSKLYSKDYLYLALYPFYSLVHIMKNLPPVRRIKAMIEGKPIVPDNTQKLSLNVLVTDGRKNVPCVLELISENGMAKVSFIYNKKKFTTGNHLRMVDAIKEITTKLDDYGFILKVCQCCKYFQPYVDGSTNMVRGFCGAIDGNKAPTLLWNTCNKFVPAEHTSMIEELSK